jgi:hypothetical protein
VIEVSDTPISAEPSPEHRYVGWFHELDAWTEYWDIYHPETRGRFYFGDGNGEQGLLTRFLPRERYPPAFVAWTRMALATGGAGQFADEVRVPAVAAAVMEVDALVASLFAKYFGDATDPCTRTAYLEAMFRCGTDSLPPAAERDAWVPVDDWRKPTAGRHMIDSDLMWFAWALHLEAAHLLAGQDNGHARRTLQLAGIATACPANFVWRGHRRTRPEYRRDQGTASLLHKRGIQWASDFDAAAQEIHTLYRIREWGDCD